MRTRNRSEISRSAVQCDGEGLTTGGSVWLESLLLARSSNILGGKNSYRESDRRKGGEEKQKKNEKRNSNPDKGF